MAADGFIALLAILVFFMLSVPPIIGLALEHRRDQKRAQQVLEDYMWTRDVRHFFKVQETREQKKAGIIFNDCPEEESARLISSRVL